MGHKKHIKRASLPVSIITSERTPENDYGVMSDPDENNMSATPVPLLTPQQELEPNAISHEETHIQSELSNSPQQSPSSQPSSQPSSPSLQSHTPETPQTSQMSLQRPPSKSLAALQLKLTRDKNFSRKITTHTFFSYIILALEIERASSASIARISPANTQHLIEYMIEHHTETEAVRIYLQTLVDTGVIQSLIEAIIEFNKDQTEAFNKLLTSEQIELELASIQENSRHNTATTAHSPQTSQEGAGGAEGAEGAEGTGGGRIRKFFKRLFGFCCCCRNRHSFRHRTSQTKEPVIFKDTEMTPPTETEKPISQEPTNPQPQPQPEPLEQSTTDVVVENQTNN